MGRYGSVTFNHISIFKSLFSKWVRPLTTATSAARATGEEERGVNNQFSSDAEVKKDSPVMTWNEWDPLEEVIVGRVDGATVPPLSIDLQVVTNEKNWNFFRENGGKPFPASHLEKARRQIDEFCNVLRHEGVTVRQPEAMDFSQVYQTPDFKSAGLYAAMPRDILLTVGDDIIEAPMAWRTRFFEYRAYRPLIKEYFRQGANWTTAPKPQMCDDLYEMDYPLQLRKLDNNNSVLGKFVTTEFEPCFDAADFMKVGSVVFAQRSHVTNYMGIEWLRRHLAKKGIKVQRLSFRDPNPMHIDGTLMVVKPGLAIMNPDRGCNEIELFRKSGWDIVEAPRPMMAEDHPMWIASKWISMNVLMLDPGRVIVEKEEYATRKIFEKLGIKCVPVSIQYASSLGGGMHCWTCDIRRRGKLESYFNENILQEFSHLNDK